jgi:hypothetical protein
LLPNEFGPANLYANAVPSQRRRKSLKLRRIILAAGRGSGAAGRLLPCARQILPGVYRALTIPDHLWRYPGAVRAPGDKAAAMRIVGSNATARVNTTSAPRRAATGGFSVAEEQAPASTAAPVALRTIGGIDALLTLQSQDDPAERRQRAVKRGRNALDMLDGLKAEVLTGTLGPATLARLKSATADLRDSSGDPGLDAVLAEIELRVEVEIAKMTPK